jgi:hypothetical protein
MKALVTGVTTPKVAHEVGQYEVTVIYLRKVTYDHVRPDTGEVFKETSTKKIRKTVFTTKLPKLHSWIDVEFA